MPYQQVFELKDEGQIHGNRLVEQSVDLGRVGIPGSLTSALFPGELEIRTTSLHAERYIAAGGGPSSTAVSFTFRGNTGTGMYQHDTNEIGFSASSGRRFLITPTEVVFGDGSSGNAFIALGGSGTAGSPTYTFEGNTGTGMYQDSVNEIAFSTSSAKRMTIEINAVVLGDGSTGNARIKTAVGNSSFPDYSFEGDTDLGMYRAGADQLGLIANGLGIQVEGLFGGFVARVGRGTGAFRLNTGTDGSVSAPPYAFVNDSSSGMYRSASGEVSIAAGGVQRLVIGTAVNVPGTFQIGGVSHGSASGAHVTNGNSHNHSGGDGAQINHGTLSGLGDVNDHDSVHPHWLSSGAGGANCHIDIVTGSVRVRPQSSLAAHKWGTRSMEGDTGLMDLNPTYFRSKFEHDDGRRLRGGFIAEEAAAANPAFGAYTESDDAYPSFEEGAKPGKGQLTGYDMGAILAAAVTEIQALRHEVDDLKGQLNELTR